jgi:hypothetical protein
MKSLFEMDAYRYTITLTPMTADELQLLIDDIRERWGRKHLVHVIGKQPSETHLREVVPNLFPEMGL